MANPSPGYSITLRDNAPSSFSATSELAAAVGAADGKPDVVPQVPLRNRDYLFKQFAHVDDWPVCLETQDTEEATLVVKALLSPIRPSKRQNG